MKILFTGGGTGGHIFPLIAIARELKRTDNTISLSYIGPKDPFGRILLSQEQIQVKSIFAGKIRRYFNPGSILQNIIDLFIKFPIGFFQAFWYLFFAAPDIVFSKGGYGSLPVVFAGWIFRIPILLQESDLSPGLANKIASRFSSVVFTSFPKTSYFPVRKIILTGNPIRREIKEGSFEEGKKFFQLHEKRQVILIFGGSQGSQKINDLILSILPDLLNTYEIIHQTGDKNFHQVMAEARVMVKKEAMQYYHAFPFLKENKLANAYQISDLIISRAGSGSIFEIAFVGKPSILIPLPRSAQDHQVKNAYLYSRFGACKVVEEGNLTPHFFSQRIKQLLSNPKEIEQMTLRAKSFAKPEAASIIATHLINYFHAR